MDSLYLSFLQKLCDAGAKYLIAGGIAVNLYGCERMTRDMDLILDLDDPVSLGAFFSSCKALNLRPLMPVRLEDFGMKAIREKWIQEKHMFVFCLTSPDNPFSKIDVFAQTPDNFQTMFTNKKTLEVKNEGATFHINLVSIKDLIEMKKAAGRDKDLLDINNLLKSSDYE